MRDAVDVMCHCLNTMHKLFVSQVNSIWRQSAIVPGMEASTCWSPTHVHTATLAAHIMASVACVAIMSTAHIAVIHLVVCSKCTSETHSHTDSFKKEGAECR
jgi:hypothetical protein